MTGPEAETPEVKKPEVKKIAALLEEVAETHHQVFRISDGADDDWASWYAEWLVTLSELPTLLATTPVRSALVYELVALDRDFTAAPTGDGWPEFYAARLYERFGPAQLFGPAQR